MKPEIYTALTIILFIIFLLVVYYLRTKKSIEIKNSDLTVAFVPIFIILLFTGAIKEFDFLGIKGTFRDTFEDKISAKDIEKLPITSLREVPKGDEAQINSLLPLNPEALTFIVGHQYFRNVIDDYINGIPSLRFILIKNESKKFIGLMEVSNYRSMNRKDDFINAIREHNNDNDKLDSFSPSNIDNS